jgi:transcriptional regulator with XRE-family HTH domain
MLASLPLVAYGCHMPTKADGATIRRLREDKGLSIPQLATLCQLDRVSVYRIETGLRQGNDRSRLRIAQALGVDVTDISYYVPPQRDKAAA